MGIYQAYGTKRDKGKPRRYRNESRCQDKKRFVSDPEARAGALLSIEERRDTDRLWVYRCKHCAGWHLTSTNHGKRYLVMKADAA